MLVHGLRAFISVVSYWCFTPNTYFIESIGAGAGGQSPPHSPISPERHDTPGPVFLISSRIYYYYYYKGNKRCAECRLFYYSAVPGGGMAGFPLFSCRAAGMRNVVDCGELIFAGNKPGEKMWLSSRFCVFCGAKQATTKNSLVRRLSTLNERNLGFIF